MNIYLLITRSSIKQNDGQITYLTELVEAFPTYDLAKEHMYSNIDGQKHIEGATFKLLEERENPQFIDGWYFFRERENLKYWTNVTSTMTEGISKKEVTYNTERWIVGVEIVGEN